MLSVALALIVTSSPVGQQVHQKRLEQLAVLEQIISQSGREPELLFRLADLWMEESRSLLVEGDAIVRAALPHEGGLPGEPSTRVASR